MTRSSALVYADPIPSSLSLLAAPWEERVIRSCVFVSLSLFLSMLSVHRPLCVWLLGQRASNKSDIFAKERKHIGIQRASSLVFVLRPVVTWRDDSKRKANLLSIHDNVECSNKKMKQKRTAHTQKTTEHHLIARRRRGVCFARYLMFGRAFMSTKSTRPQIKDDALDDIDS